MNTLFALLIVYQLKHFLADYPLQGKYMLGKFKDDWGFLAPLLAHVAVHGVFTMAIAVAFGKPELAISLGLMDATVHFCMDRIKAGKKYLGRFKPLTAEEYVMAAHWAMNVPANTGSGKEAIKKIRGNTFFWWSLGFDQMVHHLTHYACIYFILNG